MIGMPDGRAMFLGAVVRSARPRKRLTVSEWADANRQLTSKGAAETGRWRTARNPVLREIMDSLSDHSPVREVTLMKSSQIGATEGPFICTIGYYMDHAPCALMVLMPTLDSRDSWRVQKLNPLFMDTTPIKSILGGDRKRDSSNSKDIVDFPGGVLFLSGGNSPNSYAQKTVKVLLLDDLDRFPANVGGEGDPVELGRTRVKAHRRHKFLKASTPTIEGASLIDREFKAGDRRRYHVQCPHCAEFQTLKWKNVFADEKLTEAWYVCEHCGCEIDESFKTSMLAEKGHGGTARWIAARPEVKDHRSYHLSALYASLGLGPSWLDLVRLFRRIHKDPVQLKVFINSNLGETWKDQRNQLKSSEMARRAEDDNYKPGTIPPGCLAITMSVDTQDSWLEYKYLGWGEDESFWVIDHGQILGDTTDSAVWDQLEAQIHTTMTNSFGKLMKPVAVGIDSRGHRTEQVREFVMRPTLKIRVYALQGATTRMGRAISQTGSYPNKNSRGKVVRKGYCSWNVGTEHCKDYIYAHLAADAKRAIHERTFHFPLGLEEEYYNGLLAEVFDPEKKRYVQRLGAKYKRNEPLDLMVYAWAVGQHREVLIGRNRRGQKTQAYWDRLKAVYEPGVIEEKAEGEVVDAPEPQEAVPAQNDTGGGQVKKSSRQRRDQNTGLGSDSWKSRGFK